MRKIISYTILNNEADIIESFVRYNMSYVDKMIILDNGCTDNTIQILKLLKNEGYDIEIFDESLTDFEQYQIMNYYLRYICEHYESDIIIPLDSDEFLMSEREGVSVRSILEELPLDVVYMVNWRTYMMDERNAPDNFIPRSMKYAVEHVGVKVFIPTELIEKHQIVLTVGQHNVTGKENLRCVSRDDLRVAHYQNRSMNQFYAKSLCHSIRNINYLNRQNGEGIHRNYYADQCIRHWNDSDKSWFDEMIKERLQRGAKEELSFRPVDLSSAGLENIEMKYTALAEVDVLKNIYVLAQVMAIKAYNLEIEKQFRTNRPIILIYGTGRVARNLFSGFSLDLVNIRAYMNSDSAVEFTMFERRLVITPRMLKFFEYDRILIASDRFYDEIHGILSDMEIPENRIVGREYLMELSIKSLEKERNERRGNNAE